MRKRDFSHNTDDTIVAISTPAGEGGIGIVRLSGKNALSIADKIFVSKNKSKPSKFKTYTVHYGRIINNHKTIDEVILTVMRAPKSYTKENIVEINCHGGIIPLRKVLDLALGLGARLAQPGEFTKRAFINGRIDLAQAEAVLDIIKSKTDSSMKVALGHLEGELSKKINSLKEALIDALSELEAQIDFSEEDVELASKGDLSRKLEGVFGEIEKLIENAWKGIIFKEGIMCVICGKPNVGKSSLMNVLLRRNRVIVTPVPGTTRDAIEEEINLQNMPVRIVDTAGIAEAKDIIEEHGIRKSRSYINMADLILFILDLSKHWSKADEEVFKSIKGKNVITIANKSDLARKLNIDKVKKITETNEIIEVSLLRKKNTKTVEEAILRKIWHGEIPHPEATFITSLRHKKDLELAHKCLAKAIKALQQKTPHPPEIVASELQEALFFLGSILGDVVEPDILDRVFSKFCIGK